MGLLELKVDKTVDTPQVLAASTPNHSTQQVVEDAVKKLEYNISLPADKVKWPWAPIVHDSTIIVPSRV
jgi:hypothetical protein